MNAWKCKRRCITRKQARQAQGQDSMAHKFNLSQDIVGMQVILRLSNQFKVHAHFLTRAGVHARMEFRYIYIDV